MPQPKHDELSGIILSMLGPFTFGFTSPFGLILSIQMLQNDDRPSHLHQWDHRSLVVAGFGCLLLSSVMAGIWDLPPIGIEFIILYLMFLCLWLRHRLYVLRQPTPTLEETESQPEQQINSQSEQRDHSPSDETYDRPVPKPPRLAGFVMAILGIFTGFLTSPFGLLLSIEKFREAHRPRRLQRLDRWGAGLSGVSCLVLAFRFPSFNGPIFHSGILEIYLLFLSIWTWRRIFIVWPSRSFDDLAPSSDIVVRKSEQRHWAETPESFDR